MTTIIDDVLSLKLADDVEVHREPGSWQGPDSVVLTRATTPEAGGFLLRIEHFEVPDGWLAFYDLRGRLCKPVYRLAAACEAMRLPPDRQGILQLCTLDAAASVDAWAVISETPALLDSATLATLAPCPP